MTRLQCSLIFPALVLLSALLAGPAFAQAAQQVHPCGGPNQQACPPPPPLLDRDFMPEILIRELQREFTVGNPPRKPFSHAPIPTWLQRPEQIPTSYPVDNNNGEEFIP